MRIVAGRHRGRKLAAPAGAATRPTSERMRQALFDMLWHAPWAGRAAVEGQAVLDAFAGTGALGLEALSRGAASASFIEKDRAALAALRANIAACREEEAAKVLVADATRPPRAATPCSLIFLDPPYAQDLVPRALSALGAAGWIAPAALICAEVGREETPELPGFEILAERVHGAARVLVLRAPG
ncbi:16S rRNA (guanine(966)-N(2))-methyltransferase RsmD [Roseomonas marmotae]|uniref:16S rRNA (Guanine(966)-N(2))-methyltransferase RsmD n=1 Tax=Roseomonas marmotae TaxID=2768161 RepID=A0ABS3KH42_9PROT|nr:16S rRNA (guanine(966)-N(2))-methyltransferase RsmD [Roseomonas marmotae]MBO1075651.1 16S rRNA (guanine(966)-N(2))-methyltransferase RsmD [Roseomonas marmotae]QTI79512.1 16S rRNA (guanine(966)-N(2))-methyltransferase RsmD [Roseomonas marmotae]